MGFISSQRKLASNSGAICFFHFVLLFWNHVLTWVSVRWRLEAKLFLSVIVRYFFSRNFCSKDFNWLLVNAVRLLLALFIWISCLGIDPASLTKSSSPLTMSALPWCSVNETSRKIVFNFVYEEQNDAEKILNISFVRNKRIYCMLNSEKRTPVWHKTVNVFTKTQRKFSYTTEHIWAWQLHVMILHWLVGPAWCFIQCRNITNLLFPFDFQGHLHNLILAKQRLCLVVCVLVFPR